MIRFENSYVQLLPKKFYTEVKPTFVAKPKLIKWNDKLALELGIEVNSEAELTEIFSGNKILNGMQPIALVYAGHQFGHFVPQLGDGRAILLGEINNFDIQLKGSGITPYSRGGDGRSALGPVIREYIISEAMYALGVPTTRALAAVATNEIVYREAPVSGGILTRVASGHIRIGTFEYFANKDDLEGLRQLVSYALKRHYPECLDEKDLALAFYKKVIERQAALVAHWMSLGFIHGVMNTDNTSISGETIDFGPCAFMDEFKSDKVFSSIDRNGRYAYNNQPTIMQWNLTSLADCLAPLTNIENLKMAINEFPKIFQSHWLKRFSKKLGLTKTEPEDLQLIREWLEKMQNENLDFTKSFRELSQHLLEPENSSDPWITRWKSHIQLHSTKTYSQDLKQIAKDMDNVNPAFIPRNHQVERAIQGAYQNDFSIFHELCDVLKNPYQDQPEFIQYQTPPLPSERISQTFCGT